MSDTREPQPIPLQQGARMTAWLSKPPELEAIATSSDTRYDSRGVAFVWQTVFPAIGDELLMFVTLNRDDPDPPCLRPGAFPGVELRIRDHRGWRRLEFGTYRIEPGYTHTLATGTWSFAALAPWFFQSHIHIVVVDLRGAVPRVGPIFELAVSDAGPTLAAIRAGEIDADATVALSVMAGVEPPPSDDEPPSRWPFDDLAWNQNDDFWWIAEVETLVRHFNLIDEIIGFVRTGAHDALERVRDELKGYGGAVTVSQAVDVIEIFDPVCAMLLTEWWQDDVSPEGISLASIVRDDWREYFGFDEFPLSHLACQKRQALREAWTGRLTTGTSDAASAVAVGAEHAWAELDVDFLRAIQHPSIAAREALATCATGTPVGVPHESFDAELPPEMSDAEVDAVLDSLPRVLDFNYRNLCFMAICYTDLRGADFRRSWLVKADLYGSDLSGAQFDDANLFRLFMADTICRGTSFRGARLGHAGLGGADFSGADLTRADLTMAHIDGARFDSHTRFDGAFGMPLPPTFIIVDDHRLEGDEALRWLRERIAVSRPVAGPSDGGGQG